jgi:hypothetical protein
MKRRRKVKKRRKVRRKSRSLQGIRLIKKVLTEW